MSIKEQLVTRGVKILAPESVYIDESIDPQRIEAGVVIYPGTTIEGAETFIGADSQIGQGGGAWIQNFQCGRKCVLMQGTYRDSTLLDGANARNGAEIRDNCLLEEDASLGHTVGLKQSIFMTNSVAGSLINFCDVLMSGGKSRKDHSEVGSCLALYNFSPMGDKFASRFGDVPRGVFLDQPAIFVGGQTQIISPVRVGFGSIIAAGTRLTHDVGDNQLVAGGACRNIELENDNVTVHRPKHKVEATIDYINNLKALEAWYEFVRMPALKGVGAYDVLLPFAIERIKAAIKERIKRLSTFKSHIEASLAQSSLSDEARLDHVDALTLCVVPSEVHIHYNILEALSSALRTLIDKGMDWQAAVQALPVELKSKLWCEPF